MRPELVGSLRIVEPLDLLEPLPRRLFAVSRLCCFRLRVLFSWAGGVNRTLIDQDGTYTGDGKSQKQEGRPVPTFL